MSKKEILVVEDEEDILELIRFHLAKERFSVRTATNGNDAVESARRKIPALILLDLMLPGIDGLEVCRRLKKDPATAAIPIIMVTARGEESDIVAGLELGAIDYLPKPFSTKVLLARVRAALRRQSEPDNEEIIVASGITIDPKRHDVRVKDKSIDLTFSEFRILHFLASQPGWVKTREQIVDAVRGEGYAVTDRAVDVQIVGLRKKLGAGAECLETVRGVGYRFKE